MRIRRPLAASWFPVATAALLLPASPSLAWFDTGHEETAIIAWEELPPAAQAKAIQILRAHPRFQEDLCADIPENATDAERNEHIFAKAATWPDVVRSQSNPMHNGYNHPSWHYIDIPFVTQAGGDNVASAAATPAASQPAVVPPPMAPSTPDAPDNAVDALTKNVKDLGGPATSPGDRAIALCWILHIGGDLCQPLHCQSHYSPNYPKGDRGGNSEYLLKTPPYPDSRNNLHAIWDALPGDFASERLDKYVAVGIRNDPRYSRDALKDSLSLKDYMAWARESRELAVKWGYLDGHFEGTPKPEKGEPRGPVVGAPPDYIANAEKIAIRQIAVGGYRTADVLRPILSK